VSFNRVPLDVWLFSDGLWIVAADSGLGRLVGQRIVSVGGVPVAEALRRLEPYISRDNPMGIAVLGTFYLTIPSFTDAVDLGGKDGAISYELETREGQRHITRLEAPATGFRAPSFKLSAVAGSTLLWMRHPDVSQWLEVLPEKHAVYSHHRRPTPDRRSAAQQRRQQWTQSPAGPRVDRIRCCTGPSALDPHRADDVFRAQNFLNNVERWTNATIVGEPSGSKPNFAGEDTELLLPYSGLRGSISTRWWQDAGPLDRRQWIAPNWSIPVRSSDYFANRDPVLDAVLGQLK
jgi:hypothetical protein